jgi:hypothetical protein
MTKNKRRPPLVAAPVLRNYIPSARTLHQVSLDAAAQSPVDINPQARSSNSRNRCGGGTNHI